MGHLPSEMFAVGIGDAFVGVIGKVLFFLIWWSYFMRSKRVRNTYG